MYFIRSCYYKLMKHISEIEQIEHFTEYELLDRSFLKVLKQIDYSHCDIYFEAFEMECV